MCMRQPSAGTDTGPLLQGCAILRVKECKGLTWGPAAWAARAACACAAAAGCTASAELPLALAADDPRRLDSWMGGISLLVRLLFR